jgi:uncharacterized protein
MATQLTPEQRSIIISFLTAHSTMALATVTAAIPQVTPVFYVSDDAMNLYWLSSPDSRHGANIAQNGNAAVTIFEPVWQWKDFRGLQIEGVVSLVTDERIREQLLTLYLRKFTRLPDLDSPAAVTTMFVLAPKWLRWIDYGVRLGFKTEVQL